MRITFTITQLEGGGAERVMVLLAQGLLQRGHAVTVITLSSPATDFYQLPAAVQRFGLNLKYESPTLLHRFFNTGLRLVQLRRAVRASQPDVVIAFMAFMNVFTVLSLLNTDYPVIGTQHCNPQSLPIAQPWEWLRRPTYHRLNRLVSVSQGVDQAFPWLAKPQRAVIHNPVLPVPAQPPWNGLCPAGADPKRNWLIAMGRLTAAKGFDLLLTAFHAIADRHLDWQLLILGEGELRSELQTQQQNLGLTQVVFTGKISDPIPLLQRAQLFVLSSRTEGFPMALGEALACGLPAIATDCAPGIRELMRDGVDGIVVPSQDPMALAAALHELMSDSVKRQQLAHQATAVVQRFSLNRILDQWEALITAVGQPRSKLPELNVPGRNRPRSKLPKSKLPESS